MLEIMHFSWNHGYIDTKGIKERARKHRLSRRNRKKEKKDERYWTEEETGLLLQFTGTAAELARKLNRTVRAIYTRKALLKKASPA